jgi:hypothetical protein
MSAFLMLFLAGSPEDSGILAARSEGVVCRVPQGSSELAIPGTERIVLQKDGGPGHGVDQPYSVREQGAKDLDGFVGGKQVVFVAPYDLLLVLLIVVIVVVVIAV